MAKAVAISHQCGISINQYSDCVTQDSACSINTELSIHETVPICSVHISSDWKKKLAKN